MILDQVRGVKTESVWVWRFLSRDDLHRELDQYALYVGVPGVMRLGEREGGGLTDQQWETKLRIRTEIDACLARLSERFYRRLLTEYYCRGANCEAEAWREVAEANGLEAGIDSDWARREFDRELNKGVDKLWHVHAKGRSEGA